jgi:excisionase family DNA binding protein
MTAELEGLLTVREAAQRCRRNPETIRRWIWDGKLPARKLGNQLFIRAEDLERLIAPNEEAVRQERLAALERLLQLREQLARRGVVLNNAEEIERDRESHP